MTAFVRSICSRCFAPRTAAALVAPVVLVVALTASPVSARSVEPLGPAPQARSAPATVDGQDLVDLIYDVQALADEFNLLPAQRAMIGMILVTAAPDAMELAGTLADGRRAMNDALLADPVDPAVIETLAAAQGRGLADLSSLAVDTLIAVRQVLTEEQRMLLVELRALLEDRFGGLADGMKASADRQGLSRMVMRRAGPAAGDGLDHAGDALGLTPTQRAAIQAILDEAAPGVLSIAADLAANRNELLDLARNAPDDRAAIDALIDEQAALFESLALVRADVVLQVRDVLTEDQLALIALLRNALRDRLAALVGDGLGGF
ncbi:periplasmic heavy metal sensor [Halomonas denitrificans]|nr:periplasmic heavy metal sensor [Halomonas denitrificans]